jgi:hypothetical protein
MLGRIVARAQEQQAQVASSEDTARIRYMEILRNPHMDPEGLELEHLMRQLKRTADQVQLDARAIREFLKLRPEARSHVKKASVLHAAAQKFEKLQQELRKAESEKNMAAIAHIAALAARERLRALIDASPHLFTKIINDASRTTLIGELEDIDDSAENAEVLTPAPAPVPPPAADLAPTDVIDGEDDLDEEANDDEDLVEAAEGLNLTSQPPIDRGVESPLDGPGETPAASPH